MVKSTIDIVNFDIVRNNIREKLAGHNGTIRKFCIEVGISNSLLTQFLNGKSKSLSFNTLVALSRVFDCSLEELSGLKLSHGKPIPEEPQNKKLTLEEILTALKELDEKITITIFNK